MSIRRRYHLIIKESCPYCRKAMDLLDSKGYDYDTDPMDDDPELLLEIKNKLGFNTVPIIWEVEKGKRKFIGGFGELVQHFMAKPNKKDLLHG